MRSRAKAVRAFAPLNALITTAIRPLVRGSSRLSESVVRHLPRAGRATSTLPNGAKLVLQGDADDPWTSELFWRGWASFYEPEVLQLFYGLARTARTTLDIGASVGIYALVAAHANPEGRVVAFEPSPAFDRLCQNIDANGLGNLLAVQLAAGARHGRAALFSGVPRGRRDALGLLASSSLHREAVAADEVVERQAQVVPVDGFLRDRGIEHVDLVKIDTERTEPLVVEGMLETIERDRPSIVCEVLDRDAGLALEQLLGPFDYRWYHLTWMGPLERDEIVPSPTPVCQNYLFTTSTSDELLTIVEEVRAGIK